MHCTVGAVRAVRGAGRGVAIRTGDFHLLAQSVFEFVADVRIFLKECAGVFAALAHAFAGVANPCAGLFENAFVHAEVDQVAFARNAFAVENVEFSFAERRGNLVLYDFGARTRADHSVAILDGLNAANVHTHGCVKLERAAAGSRFRIAEHDTDLFADQVDEDEAGARL